MLAQDLASLLELTNNKSFDIIWASNLYYRWQTEGADRPTDRPTDKKLIYQNMNYLNKYSQFFLRVLMNLC
jgi:hypothetical protein